MIVNGKSILLENPCTLAEYLEKQKYQPKRIAVEMNGNIVPKSKYASVILQEQDRLEIVSFVGGG